MDSAAKHQIAVKTSYEHLLSWVGYEQVVLQKEKHAFAVGKDDLVVGVGKPVRKNERGRGNQQNKAYPSVVATLARMDQSARNYLIMLLHDPSTHQERDALINNIERFPERWDPNMSEVAKKQISEMPDFYFCGYSVGFAYAHPLSGDTQCTSMIGGMRTVLNGAFEVNTGDMIQWYWEAETNCFDADGKRHDPINDRRSHAVNAFLDGHNKNLSMDEARRKAFYDRGNGAYANVKYDAKKEIAYPKSLKHGRDGKKRLSDQTRVFGRAMSSARRFEFFDIMICRQSM